VESGDTLTGDFTSAEGGTDLYTLAESGDNGGGSLSEVVTGTDGYSASGTGNHDRGSFDGTTTGGGDWTRTSSGAGAVLGSDSGTNGYTLTESDDSLAGHFSQTRAGTDRYGLVDDFGDVSNSGPGATPGNITFHSHGLPFRDPTFTEEARAALFKLGLSEGQLEQLANGERVWFEPAGTPKGTTAVAQFKNGRFTAGILTIDTTLAKAGPEYAGKGMNLMFKFQGDVRSLATLLGAQEAEVQGIQVIEKTGNLAKALEWFGYTEVEIDAPPELGGGKMKVWSRMFKVEPPAGEVPKAASGLPSTEASAPASPKPVSRTAEPPKPPSSVTPVAEGLPKADPAPLPSRTGGIGGRAASAGRIALKFGGVVLKVGGTAAWLIQPFLPPPEPNKLDSVTSKTYSELRDKLITVAQKIDESAKSGTIRANAPALRAELSKVKEDLETFAPTSGPSYWSSLIDRATNDHAQSHYQYKLRSNVEQAVGALEEHLTAAMVAQANQDEANKAAAKMGAMAAEAITSERKAAAAWKEQFGDLVDNYNKNIRSGTKHTATGDVDSIRRRWYSMVSTLRRQGTISVDESRRLLNLQPIEKQPYDDMLAEVVKGLDNAKQADSLPNK
jgi:hypothetical protein